MASGFNHKRKYYAKKMYSCCVCKVMSRILTLDLNAKKYITNELENKNRKIAAADCQSLRFRGCGKTICFIELSIMIISIKMMISCQLLKPLHVYERENSSRVFIIQINDFSKQPFNEIKDKHFFGNMHMKFHTI